MASSKSALKRIRQNETHKVRNRSRKSALRSQIKKVRVAIDSGNVDEAQGQLRLAMKQADKSAKAHCIHRNAASRLKSRLARDVNAMA